jgi:methionyl-tRNA synthetase
MASRFYVTTPIYYINDVPHLGSAYTTIAADVLARYHRLRGDETRFLTGTDEHGLKIQRAAAERGVSPQAFADEISGKFRETWPRLDCAFDDFIRTTEPRHKAAAQDLWRTIRDNPNKAQPNIYLGHYEGLYCVGCEGYYTEKELEQPGNICPTHKKPVEMVKEESYFFRLSAYADDLLAYYESHPDFVQPPGRLNEVKSFVKAGLQDLSVSRTTFQWGIPVPDDARHVMYVWFDALTNYRSALLSPENREHLWPHAVHLVGKDILRFHAIFWPAFLLAAGLPLPKHVFAHGFLTVNEQKMSKSLRNTVHPVALAEALSPEVGVDVVRYCLMRSISFGQDGDFSIKDVMQRYTSELGNALGNLVNRVQPFDEPARKGRAERGPLEQKLIEAYETGAAATARAFDELSPTRALDAIWGILAAANDYVDKAAPWASNKKEEWDRLAVFTTTTLELLDGVSVMVAPVMPRVSAMIRERLALEPLQAALDADRWPATFPRRALGAPFARLGAIFPRFEKEREAEILAQFAPPPVEAAPVVEVKKPEAEAPKPEAKKPEAREPKATITYEDFTKLDLRVGVILSAERVKKKDKLLDLRVDTGDAEPRRIVAGIASAYTPEQLVGKRVAVLCNLAPRDFGKGLVSQGMILAAEDEGGLAVLLPEREKAAGSSVS